MLYFKRALGFTLALFIIFIVAVLAFSKIDGELYKSGFSSGNLFAFEQQGDFILIEVFGKRFSFDLFGINLLLSGLSKLVFLLPVPVQLLVYLFSAAF